MVIRSPLSVEQATAGVQRAAVDSGFIVSGVDLGVVTVGPYKIPNHPDVTVMLRANIVAGDSGSVVQVTGVATDLAEIALSRALVGAEWQGMSEGVPIDNKRRGRYAWRYAEVQRFATAIRARIE
jgi:hypothetical protein